MHTAQEAHVYRLKKRPLKVFIGEVSISARVTLFAGRGDGISIQAKEVKQCCDFLAIGRAHVASSNCFTTLLNFFLSYWSGSYAIYRTIVSHSYRYIWSKTRISPDSVSVGGGDKSLVAASRVSEYTGTTYPVVETGLSDLRNRHATPTRPMIKKKLWRGACAYLGRSASAGWMLVVFYRQFGYFEVSDTPWPKKKPIW